MGYCVFMFVFEEIVLANSLSRTDHITVFTLFKRIKKF
jgi:hypothetical protein